MSKKTLTILAQIIGLQLLNSYSDTCFDMCLTLNLCFMFICLMLHVKGEI